MATFQCNDGSAEVTIEAETAKAAAQAYVDGGDYECEGHTTWVVVWVEDDEAREPFKVAVNPTEPPCKRGQTHDWSNDAAVVGGLPESPGVRGNGGGVISIAFCTICGCGRSVDTWAQDRQDGQQGLTSVAFVPGAFSEVVAERAAAATS